MESLEFQSLFAAPIRNGIYKSKEFQGRGVRLVKMNQLFSERRLHSQSEGYELIDLTDKEEQALLLQKNDLLFSRTSVVADGVGKCSIIAEVEEKLTWDSNIIRVRLNPNFACPQFYFYFFNSSHGRDVVKRLSSGAAITTITGSGLAASHVPAPALPIQRRIASILSAYDDLIENSQRRIQILEQMSRALYREWFVKFRYPGHESVPLVPSPLGEIPQGWELKPAPDCIDVNPRVSVPRDGEKPFVPMGCLSNNSMVIADVESREGSSGSKFRNGDTLFARITPCLENGKTGFVQFLPDADSVAFGSTEFIVLRSRSLTPEFVYCLARSEEFRSVAIKSMSGASGRQRVQEKCFDSIQIAQPPQPLLDKFSTVAAPGFSLVFALHAQVQNLRRTRDLLLPRLISGQIDLDAA
jgi:type I restriction enzyme S subunit